jgi:fluoroquinolone transport system permease protein
MRRLAATVGTDVRLQFRNGFYYAAAFIVAMVAFLAMQLPDLDWSPWLAPIIFGNLVTATYFFIGGLVLLEKAEGTLEAQVVTPLRVSEYLGSKVVTLAALSVIENIALVALIGGFHYRFGLLALGVVCAAVIYILLGFVAVARYDSINEYLMPSVLYVWILSIPMLDYFELWTTPLMILHPLQGALVLIRAAFIPVAPVDYLSGLLSALIWIVIASMLGRRAYQRFVIRKEGVS